jgi:beta-lactamase superfamily II metal-dependent hydrolase
MSIIKSVSVGDGDLFYIKHAGDTFTIIDCCIDSKSQEDIVSELKKESKDKSITRFISTHPDDDHILGLKYLNEQMPIVNFYCVKNETTKKETTEDFEEYCKLRDSDKAYYLKKGCKRKWLNDSNEERGSSGIEILWPDTDNDKFKEQLEKAKNGESPNNISPVIGYSLKGGASILWLGDIESIFLDSVYESINFSKTNILFAPHHGRDSGKISKEILDIIKPDVVIIGEAPSKDLNYYKGQNTITQNTAGDITLVCENGHTDFYVSNSDYSVDFLDDEGKKDYLYYLGTLNIDN